MSRPGTFGDFKCTHCGHVVSSAHWLSGVNNRNHCPYCLWSRHLDLYSPGDRLAACKAPMQPVALTTKRSRNKFSGGHGELMLVHLCVDCNDVSINRIAADDVATSLMEVFDASLALPTRILGLFLDHEINILRLEAFPQLQIQLFGQAMNVSLAEAA